MEGYVEYKITDESLDAIVVGLDISSGDKILAICGSGDQAFAMAERGAKVLAVDKISRQIEYAKKRADLIRNRKFNDFLKIDFNLPLNFLLYLFDHSFGYLAAIERTDFANIDLLHACRRNWYFRRKGRLERLADNIDNVDFLVQDILKLPNTFSHFSKIYLSNVPVSQDDLMKLSKYISVDGLIYSCWDNTHISAELCSRLRLNPELTLQSNKKEKDYRGLVKVYRKVSC